MERIQRLVRSLRTARAAELPTDPRAAVSTLLPLVMRNESKAVAELLLSSDFDVNFRIGSKRTLLHIAANVGAYDCLVILIKKDADVNCQDKSGVTPLQLAARNGHIKCIHKLLESKADIRICNSDGMTALHWIASNGRTELLSAILPFIKNIDIEDVNKQTPLHLACLTGHKFTVQKLIGNGADFHKLDVRGYSPIFYACSHGHAEIVNYLLEKGAKLLNNYDEISPLQIALENGHKEVCFVLIESKNKLLDNLLTLAQDSSITEEKALSVLRYLAGMKEEYHRAILLRLADRSKSAGLELMSASSNYDKIHISFFKNLSLLCCLNSISEEEMLQRPRTGSLPTSVRSRFDSTSVRVLRTLTNSVTQNALPFQPPAAEIDELLNVLWNSLESWFILIREEIHRIPDSSSVEENPGCESAKPKADQNPDTVSPRADDQDLETRLIASELVRSKPIDLSVRPRSTASMESIRLSQPALEFNIALKCGDLNSSRGLSRDLGRKLLQRSISSNQEAGRFLENPDSPEAEDDENTIGEHDQGAQGTFSTEEMISWDRTELAYENEFMSSNGVSLNDSAGCVFTGREEATGQEGGAGRGSVVSEEIENEYLNAASFEASSATGSNRVLGNSFADDMIRNSSDRQPFVRRSISYTYAIGDTSATAENTQAERGIDPPFMRMPSIESRSAESLVNSHGALGNHMSQGDAPCMTNVASVSASPGDSTDTLAVETSKMTDDEVKRVSVVEVFADRLCAVVHGYHLVSGSRPYWESSRKFKIRVSKFQDFIERNEEVLQLFVARKPKLIFDHFQFLLDSPLLLQRYLPVIQQQPFRERLEWFYENLHKDENTNQMQFDEKSLLTISREELLLSSCGNFMKKEGSDLKRNLAVRFEGEAGMGEGVVREWLDLLFKEVLNPDYALFTLSSDGSTFQPNSNSTVNPDHLNYFLFAGRMMGLAMYHKKLISASFTRSFYKHILGIPVNYQDVASMDPEYAKSLQWILDNDISDLGLDLNFAVETKEFGQVQLVDLKLGGADILVTENNKEEYIQLAADMKMTKAIKPQIYSFLEGFHEFIPHSLVALFDEYELELVLSGVQEIDCEDWERNSIYQAGYTAESQQVKWFWETVKDFDQDDRALLLKFVTGSSRVPWGGFASLVGAAGPQKFTISAVANAQDTLPSSSTCFNLLKLPEYENKEDLVEKLRTALKHGASGFEFA